MIYSQKKKKNFNGRNNVINQKQYNDIEEDEQFKDEVQSIKKPSREKNYYHNANLEESENKVMKDIQPKKKKPSRSNLIKQLEKDILDQSFIIQKEKNKYKQLVSEYHSLKNNE